MYLLSHGSLLLISLLQTDCPDFTVDKSLGASPGFQAGCEAGVEVCFEPQQLGEVKGQLTLSSAIGGEYIFPLVGICTHPKAQGPFSIRAGRNVTIHFRNVFAQSISLSYQVNNSVLKACEDTSRLRRSIRLASF